MSSSEIENIQLRNVLAFRNASLEMRRLTVLTGTNSAGKSSVLRAIAMLRQSQISNMLPQAWLLNGDLVSLGTGRDLLHSDPESIGDSRAIEIQIAIRYRRRPYEWTAQYDATADVLLGTASPSKVNSTLPLFADGFQYLRADRITPAVTYPKSHEAVVRRNSLGAQGEHSANYLHVLGGQMALCEPAINVQVPDKSLLGQTNAWLQALAPGTLLAVDDAAGTDYVRLSYRRTGPEVKTESQRATNVGFGLTYVLPILIACLMATRGRLLLIENPEAHLHPRGQAIVGRLCALAASGGAQVILETHSDHVLNAVRLAVKEDVLKPSDVIIQFFTRTSNDAQPAVSRIDVGSDGMIGAWPNGFFDEWDRALSALLD